MEKVKLYCAVGNLIACLLWSALVLHFLYRVLAQIQPVPDWALAAAWSLSGVLAVTALLILLCAIRRWKVLFFYAIELLLVIALQAIPVIVLGRVVEKLG